jgi:hypothetical protein
MEHTEIFAVLNYEATINEARTIGPLRTASDTHLASMRLEGMLEYWMFSRTEVPV